MVRTSAALLAAALLAVSCSAAAPAPSASPTLRSDTTTGSCPTGDHYLDHLAQFGWAFCYPGTWKFQERVQPSTAPSGVDDTFDVVNDVPKGQPGSGDFGFMIIGSYQIGGAATTADWVKANVGAAEQVTPIRWGNSKDAVVDDHGRRFALTAHRVVELDVRGDAIGQGMAANLATWQFA